MFEQLMKDATPKAETLKNATINVTNKVANSKAVQTSKSLGYKALVNTVGVGLVLAQPLVEKSKALAFKGWNKVEELAKEEKK